MKRSKIRFGGPPKSRDDKPKVIDSIEIERLALDGRGVGKINGKTVFVEGALPNERVSARIITRKKRYDVAEVEEIQLKSPDRIDPPCPHFGQCGGCDLQHLSDTTALELKQTEILSQLKRMADCVPTKIDAPIHSPNLLGYRRTARIGINQRASGELIMGFRRRASNQLVDIETCPVLDPAINSFAQSVRALLAQESKIKQITQLRVSLGDQYLSADLRLTKPIDNTLKERLKELAESHQVQLRLIDNDGQIEYLNKNTDPQVYSLDNGIRFRFESDDFLQVNGAVNAALIDRVISYAQPKEQDRVLDLFSGLGNFSIPFAKKVKEVVAIEGSRKMVERSLDNAKLNNLTNIRAQVADLNSPNMNSEWLQQNYNLILIDPPREGAAAIIESIKPIKSPALIYLACEPASLIRDTKTLMDQGYILERFSIADMFPQTHHIESLALFTRA